VNADGLCQADFGDRPERTMHSDRSIRPTTEREFLA
jgi:hypothetical protein